ncbi:DUF7167 family protein [Hymenobacter metallicola]|uniref:DUF7167 domain-containing protein n=1 Tax=Hymenobacter metallicola TaxID=2563114 RepID=A0A4Z0QI81_9BACT|nr:hypothetical protein E5K02_10045 [Hymenobacter metallicola]
MIQDSDCQDFIEIQARFTVHIGQGGVREETVTVEVPAHWDQLSDNQKREYLFDDWKEWAYQYVDGSYDPI